MKNSKFLSIALILILSISFVSAVWYNPFTWFSNDIEVADSLTTLYSFSSSTTSGIKINQEYIASELNFTVTELELGTFRVDWNWKENGTLELKNLKSEEEIKNKISNDGIFYYQIEERLLGFVRNITLLENYTYINETTFYNKSLEVIDWIWDEEKEDWIKKITYGGYQTIYETIEDTRWINTTEKYQELRNISIPYKKDIYKKVPNNELCIIDEATDIETSITYFAYDSACNLNKYQDKIASDILNLDKYPIKNARIDVGSAYDFSGDSDSFTFEVPTNIFGYTVYGNLFDLGFGTATFTLNDHADGTFTGDNTPSFEFKVIGNVSAYDVELFFNNVSYGTVNAVNNTLTTITANDSLADGVWEWYLNAYNASDGYYNSTFRTITIDTIAPYIEFDSSTIANGSTTQNASVDINISIIESDLGSVVYAWNYTNYTYYNDSLVLMFNFDDWNRLNDTSSYGNNGTCSGASCPTWQSSGKYNGAYNFDAIDDYVLLDDQGDTFAKSMCDDGCSMCVWAKPEFDNHDNWQYIFGRFDTAGYYNLYVLHGVQSTTGTLTMTMYGMNDADSISLLASSGANLEEWNYLCYVYDGSNTTLGNTMIYNNGVLLETSATQIQINSSYWAAGDEDFMLGTTDDSGNKDRFNGTLDEVRIWGRGLNSNEIYQQYVSNLQKFNSTLWNFYVNQSLNATDGLLDGNYTYQAFATDSTGNENQTEIRDIEVTSPDATVPYFTSTSFSDTITYGTDWTGVNLNATDETLFDNFIIISNTDFIINSSGFLDEVGTLGAGTYEVNVTINDTTNNLNSSIFILTVSQIAEDLVPMINGTNANFSSLNDSNGFLDDIMINASLTTSGIGLIEVYFNGSLISNETLPSNLTDFYIGYYNVTYISRANENYTSDEEYLWINITESVFLTTAGTLTFTLNDSLVDISFIYGGELTASANSSNQQVSIYRDNVNVTFENGTAITLGVGTYNYTAVAHATATINETSRQINLTVSQAVSAVNLTLNNTNLNYSIENNTILDLNCSTVTGDASAFLETYNNGSLINNGTSPTTNTTTFDYVDYFNVTCIYGETQNYSSTQAEYWINVTASVVPDTTPPTFTDLGNATISYLEGVIINLNATDETEFDCFVVNDTSFAINCSGWFENASANLGVGYYGINITINDTIGNLNSDLVYVNITSAEEILIPMINGTNANFSSLNDSNGFLNDIIINASLTSGIGLIEVYFNGSLISNKTLPSNLTDLYIGYYNVTYISAANENYTSDEEVLWINITESVFTGDNTLPYFTSTSFTDTITYGTNWTGVNLNATDNIALDTFVINDSRFTINSSGFLNDINILGAGTYNINVTINDSSNNLNSSIFSLTINQDTGDCDLKFSPPVTVLYGDNFKVWSNCNSDFQIYFNGTEVANYSQQTDLGAWTHNFEVFRNDTGNYTIIYDQHNYTVTKAPGSVIPYVNNVWDNFTAFNTSDGYSTIDLNATLFGGSGLIEMWLNGSIIYNGSSKAHNSTNLYIGEYNFTAVYRGTENYTASERWLLINISESSISSGQLTFTLNDSLTSISFVYEGEVTAIANSTIQEVSIFRDNVNVTNENGTAMTLGVGTYNYTAVAYAIDGYAEMSTQINLTITQATGIIANLIAGANANYSATNDTNGYKSGVAISATLSEGVGDIKVYWNGSLIAEEGSPNNSTDMYIGYWNATYVYDGNENYTADWEILWANITESVYTAPSTSALCRYRKFGYYNLNLPWMKEPDCI